jgi:hypothetical protein
VPPVRGAFIFAGLLLGIVPLAMGYFAALFPIWSPFWWDVTLYLYYGFAVGYAVLGIVGLHKIRFFAMIPTILLSNTTLSLCLIGLWRLSYEHGVFAYLLLFSHLMNVFFSFIYSKECLTRNFKKTSDLGRTIMKIVMFLPLTWFYYFYEYFFFEMYIFAACFYYLNLGAVALSIRFREPNWEPRKKNASL